MSSETETVTTPVDTQTEVTTPVDTQTEVKPVPRRIPPMPSSWAQIVKRERGVKTESEPTEPQVALTVFNAMQEHAEDLEGQLASKIAEIDDLTNENRELKEQINALQLSLEESENRAVERVVEQAEEQVEPVLEQIEVETTVDTPAEVVIPIQTEAEAPAAPKGWFGWW